MGKSLNEIILELIEAYRTSLPDLDTKAGTVARNLFIDVPADQISSLYSEIDSISNLQSLRLVSGADLEKLGQNYGSSRKSATTSTGIALLTFSSIPANIGINSGEIITAQSGATFSVINGLTVDSSKTNYYRSIALKYQNDLDFLGITDQYAVEVSVRASVPGANGNISKYSLATTSIPSVSSVTNTFAFTGGVDQEDDTSYRNRILSIFSGSNIGTALGYKNTVLTNPFVQDAVVIEPGDVLMTRDGTIVNTAEDGTKTIVSEGTGGKVDVVVLGGNIAQNIDTFIYRDKSNKNDPTDNSNNIILGQITGDENKTITRRRIDNIANGILPSQPADEIVEVTGTLSGSNFISKSIDSLGRITGNYELVKDTGTYSGSAWGSDTFKWINNKIEFQEDIIKSQFNGQDSVSFADVLTIPKIQQNILIGNENSTVLTSDRSIIKLLHTPSNSVTRVLNTNTGERYTVVNQNLDGGTPYNNSGRIKISGSTLPSTSDILQVDYTWIVDYDPYSDYDGKIIDINPRSSIDSIDWGLSNAIRSEIIKFILSSDGVFYTGNVSMPVSSVISANTFKTIIGKVEQSTVVNFTDRLAISLSEINSQITDISSIKLVNTEKELYLTASSDGLFLNNRVVVGVDIKYNISIVLPTDTKAEIGQYVQIIYNEEDVFNITDYIGSFINKTITIPSNNITDTPSEINLDIKYISSLKDLLSYNITGLPVSRENNGFILSTNSTNKNTITSNCIGRQNQTVQKDNSDNLYVKLTLSSSEYSLTIDNVITIINISNGKEFWNADGYGTISIDTDLNYVLTLSGLNNPIIGDQVLIVYRAVDIFRSQPFTFYNNIIKYNLHQLSLNYQTNTLYCPLNSFIEETSLTFNIINPITNEILATAADGYISNINSGTITFSSISYNFSLLSEIMSKQILITGANNLNNNGLFNIIEYINSNNIIISPLTDNISENQISVIRLLDNKDILSSTSTLENNTITFPSSTNASSGDKVLILLFTNKVIRQTPTKLSINLSDQLVNSGTLTISGTSVTNVTDIVFTATQNGLKQNVLEAMKTYLGSTSTSIIGSDKSIIRILKLEKVTTTTGNEVLSSDITYDIFGTEINNDLFYSNMMNIDSSLSNMEFTLPSTTNNINNKPIVGDKLRISFVYATTNDSENIYFTRNGTLYTNKKFAIINKLFILSGFNSSQSARFIVSLFTQPSTGSRYRVFYTYVAPKQNERILIRSNYNQVISDATFTIEANRPINADVLIRAAKQILVDSTINIVIKSDFLSSSAIVLQNVKDRIINTINTNILGDTLNSSDLIAAAQSIDGVDRVRIVYFNKSGEIGQVLTIVNEKDEYFVANNITINSESR